MENWRKFLKEGPDDESSYYSPALEEPSEGFYDDDYNPEGFEPDVDDLGPEGPEAMIPPSDEDLEGEVKFDPQAREDFKAREAIYSNAYDASGDEALADQAVEDSMQYSGEELERIAYPDFDDDESFDD